MKKYFLSLLSFLPLLSAAQNVAQCDSLVIDCCDIGTDSITLTASNATTRLFDYPGFVLFDSNMDTIAKENVNYFGIGSGLQTHYMVVLAPLNLPFTGYLNLYSWYYDSLDCSFPITIADTASGINDLKQKVSVSVYPNPSHDKLLVNSYSLLVNTISIVDVLGTTVLLITDNIKPITTIDVSTLSSGIYFLEVRTHDGILSRTKFIKQ